MSEKLTPLLSNNVLAEKELPVYGDGEYIRGWLYVEDHREVLHMVSNGLVPWRVSAIDITVFDARVVDKRYATIGPSVIRV